MEGGPFTEFTIEPDAPTLHFHQALGDVQAQTGSRCFTRLGIFRAENSLEDPGLVLKTDANAVILHP